MKGKDQDTCFGFCNLLNRQENGGYVCGLNPATKNPYCTTICGDGIIRGKEECDVGLNFAALKLNDISGCFNCSEVEGFNCYAIADGRSKCDAICGDKKIVGDETCDVGTVYTPGCINCQIQ